MGPGTTISYRQRRQTEMCQLLEPDKCPELAASSADCLRLWVSRSRHLHLHNLLLAIEAYQRLSARDFRPACFGSAAVCHHTHAVLPARRVGEQSLADYLTGTVITVPGAELTFANASKMLTTENASLLSKSS